MTIYAQSFASYIKDKARDKSGFKPEEIALIITKLGNLDPDDESQDRIVQVQKGYTRSRFRWFNPSTWKMFTQRTINIFVAKDKSVLILKSDKNILGFGKEKKGSGKFGFKIAADGTVSQELFYVTVKKYQTILIFPEAKLHYVVEY